MAIAIFEQKKDEKNSTMNEESTRSLSSANFSLFSRNVLENSVYSGTDSELNNVLQISSKQINDNSENNSQLEYKKKAEENVFEVDILSASKTDQENIHWSPNPKNDSEIENHFNLDEDINQVDFFDEELSLLCTTSWESKTVNTDDSIFDNQLSDKKDAIDLSNNSNLYNQLEFNKTMIKRLNKNDYFTVTIAQNESSSSAPNKISEADNFVVVKACENVQLFLNLKQAEVVGKNLKSLISPDDLGKLSSIFLSLNRSRNSTKNSENNFKHDTFKSKSIVCHMLVNSQQSNQNNNSDSNLLKNMKKYEAMVLVPIKSSHAPKINDYQLTESSLNITFAIKNLKKNNMSKKAQLSNSSVSSIPSISPSSNPSSINVISSGFFSNPNNDINMDQFKTKMNEKGFIISAEIDNLKCSFNNISNISNMNSGKTGLFLDIKMGKTPNIFEYVHSNDQQHISQHIQNVITKSENTSAIYRLKINEKYAFLQTQSKMISKRIDQNINFDKERNNDEPVICSIHSIIKEIDTDVEMKGNASTSLMKTLISKKPASGKSDSASSKADQKPNKNSANLNNFLKTLVIEEPSTNKAQSKSDSTKPSTGIITSPPNKLSAESPVGTQFALTMLGLSNDVISLQSKEINDRTNSSKDLTLNLNNPSKMASIPNEIDDMGEESDIKRNFNTTDQKNSSRKNNVLLKKLLLEGDCTGNESQYNEKDVIIDHNELGTFLNDKKENLFNHNRPSSPVLSPEVDREGKNNSKSDSLNNENSPKNKNNTDNNSQTKIKNGYTSKTKDDIILRTLLNTSDLEPQLLNLESVFDLNSSKNDTKKEETLCETQNQQKTDSSNKKTAKKLDSEPRKRKKMTKSVLDKSMDDSYSPSQDGSLDTDKKSNKKTNKTNKRNARSLYTNLTNSNNISGSSKKNKNDNDFHYIDSHNQQYDMLNNSNNVSNEISSQIKIEKVNNMNYLNKENDSITHENEFYMNNQNNSQSYTNQPNNSYNNNNNNQINNNSKKIKLDKNPQNINSIHQPVKNQVNSHNLKENEFPSSLASSTISVSSNSSLSSPSSNHLLTSNSNNLNGVFGMNLVDSSLLIQNQDNNGFLNFTNELLDDFHLNQSIGSTNQLNNTKGFTSNINESEDTMFKQLEQVLSIKSANLNELDSIGGFDPKSTGLSVIIDQNNLGPNKFPSGRSKIEDNLKRADKHVKNNASNPIDTTKDDDITKKKRIEAISKHLKSDLIESFKSSQLSSQLSNSGTNNMSFENYNSRSLLTTTPPVSHYTNSYQSLSKNDLRSSQFHHNESFDHDLNNSFNSSISPISNSANKPIKSILSKVDETYVPNLTIEPPIYSQDGSRISSSFNKFNSKSSKNLTDLNKNSEILPGNQTMNYFNQSSEDFNSTNYSCMNSQHNYKNDPTQINLRKKLQERIQRNSHPYQIPNNTTMISPNPNAHYQQPTYFNQDISNTNLQSPVQSQSFPNSISSNSSIQYNSPSNLSSQPYNQQTNPIQINTDLQGHLTSMKEIQNQPSPVGHHLKSQYISYEKDNGDMNFMSSSSNSYNFACSSPISININQSHANNSFSMGEEYDDQFNNNSNKTYMPELVKKQLGNTVNKRIQQSGTKQGNISPYYNKSNNVNSSHNNFPNDSYLSSSLPSSDIHQMQQQHISQLTKQPQYQKPPVNNSSISYYAQSLSPTTASMNNPLKSDQASKYSPQYVSNHYHQPNYTSPNNHARHMNTVAMPTNQIIEDEKLLGFNTEAPISYRSKPAQLDAYQNSHEYNNFNYSMSGYQNQQRMTMSQKQGHQYQERVNYDTFQNTDVNYPIPTYDSNNNYFNEENKGSLLQQLLLD